MYKTDSKADMLYSQAVSDLQGNIDNLQRAQIMKEAIDINRFMNLAKECAKIDVSDLDQDVLNEFIQGPAYESDKEIKD
jgi:hypothetical protein